MLRVGSRIERCLVAGIAATMMVAATTGIAMAEGWRQYRHDAAHTGTSADEMTLGVQNVSGLQLRWSVDTAGPVIAASPVIANGRAFIGTRGQGSAEGYLSAFDVTTGALIWRQGLWTGTESSAAVADGRVYALSEVGALSAYRARDGKRLWRVRVGQPYFSQLVLREDVIYVRGDPDIVALQADDGTEIWRAPAPPDLYGTPTVTGGRLYYAAGDQVVALDASTGTEVWSTQIGDVHVATPAVSGGRLYVATETEGLFCLYTSRGAVAWHAIEGAEMYDVAPAVADGTVFVQIPGRIVARDAVTGAFVWRSRIASGGDPTVTNGVLWSVSGDLSAADASTGQLLASLDAGGGAQSSSPSIADGVVYVGVELGGGNGALMAFDLPA